MSANPFALSGKRLLVVGAYSGIGKDFCAYAAGEGAILHVVGRSEELLEQLRAELGSAIASQTGASIESIDGFKRILKTLAAEQGPFDGVFHCAGREMIASARALSQKDFDAIFAGSVLGAAALISLAAGKSFLAPGGSLVMMSSVSSERPQNGLALYSASKATIDALVKSAATELAARGSRINSIVAGAVRTRMLESSLNAMPPAARERYEAEHVLGFGKPRDITHAAAYLMSDASQWVTGTTLVVDGGFLL